MQKRISLFAAFLLLCATTVMAQVTTSGMSGKVTDGKDDVIGAIVEVTHTPSGTRYKAVTNSKGQFTINGMRVGGPYEVKINYIGYQTKVVNGITLQLGETYRLKTSMTEDTKELSNVIVTGSASKFAYEKTGASTNISNAQILATPTVNRSITDITRLSPYGGNGMTFAGTDGRTANFTVDGASFNNNFGLSSNLPGGGSPISIDAIEELQVVISPFDVRQTNFIGGGVNAITKSGTNTLKGSLSLYHKNEQMRGDAVEGEAIAGAREKDRKTTVVATLGGPIIKDKLFFFVNVDYSKIPTIANRWRASEDGVADADNYISHAKAEDLQTVSDYVARKDTYNYNTGSYTSFPADESNLKLLGRIDWNINDMHHLAVRYNYTKNRNWNAPNRTSMDGGTRSAYDRMGLMAMSYANSMYAMDNKVYTWSFDLNSRINDKLSNQFLATYSKISDVRYTDSDEFPFIDILDGTGTTSNYISLGYELFTYHNAVNNDVVNIKDEVTYYLDAHKITAGLGYEYQMADNQYMRNGTGYYRYASVDDFINGAAPEIVALTYGYNGESDPASRVRYNKGSIYAQDDWNVNDNLKLTLGLRFDGLFFNNCDLMTNNAILALDYNGQHLDTGKWPGNTVTISPRVGFNWDVFGDHSLKVRGGTGLFAGHSPLVFFTNMPQNSGMIQYAAALNSKNADMSQFAGGLVTDANGHATIEALKEKILNTYNLKDKNADGTYNKFPNTITPEQGSKPSTINAVDPSFKMPQVWKTSLAVDYNIPVSFPLTVTVEGIVNKTVNAACISDLSIPNVGGFTRFNGADNRPIYPEGFRGSKSSAFVLSNTGKGYGYSTNFTVTGRPFEWMSFMAAYTHQAYKEITSMPGSNAESAFTYVPTYEGPNNIHLHNAINTTPDRVIASLTLHDKSNNHYSFIYEGWRGGNNYSYMMVNDMNGDGYNYDALYIPTDEEVANNQFRFVSEDDQNRFMSYVHNNDYLSAHQGEYAEAYSVYSPWVHRIDLGYKHDFILNTGKIKHTFQLSFDMKNVLNFFNSSWGVQKYLNPQIGTEARILKYEGMDKDGYATYSTPTSINGDIKTFVPSHTIGQCWYASIGIKYMFN
ncbi:MAG: TonB-dependent receptor [Bacteroidaceae bacterium]|nr:TonB-dependent receptor [Bacteroidaceae bacterium]